MLEEKQAQARKAHEQKSELTLLDILRVLSRQQNMFVFRTIAIQRIIDREMINKLLNMSRSDQSKSLSELFRLDLIRRKSGKYCLTSLGKLIYDWQIRAENMLSLRHNLKVVDSIEHFADNHRNEIINCVIKDPHAKDLLMQHDLDLSSRIQNTFNAKEEEREKDSLPLPRNIMIIEDEPDLLFTYKLILQEEGYNVYGFVDPYKALEALLDFYNSNEKKIDLLIVDIRMPKLNGLQVYRTFKAVDENVKTIFVSALAEADELLRVYPGDDSVQLLKKPIDKDYFIKEVGYLLSI
jgi:CheY-like chemotaxis protein